MSKSIAEQIALKEQAIKRNQEEIRRLKRRQSQEARKRMTHLKIELGGILTSADVLGFSEEAWGDENNRRRLLAAFRLHAPEIRRWAVDAGVTLPPMPKHASLPEPGEPAVPEAETRWTPQQPQERAW